MECTALEVYIKALKPILLPERIHLFFTNFRLAGISQYNASSPAVY